MGMPAKKKASANQDDRKPRTMKSYAAFICAQPYDIPAKEIARAARAANYDVVSITAVGATRERYPNLRYETGDPPTAYVIEFLASSSVGQKAKAYTTSKSGIAVKTAESSRPLNPVRSLKKERPLETLVDRVLGEALAEGASKSRVAEPSVVEVPKPLPRAAQHASAHGEPERAAQAKSEPATPAAEPKPAELTEPKPKPEAVAAPIAAPATSTQVDEEEDDDVQLQELREQFEIGDPVRVTHPAGNGASFTREGRILGKERAFALVLSGSTTQKIAYKRLILVARKAGNGARANSNGDVVPIKPLEIAPAGRKEVKPVTEVRLITEAQVTPLKVVPPAFAQLKAVVPGTKPEQRKQEAPPKEKLPVTPAPKPATAPKPEAAPPAAVATIRVPVVPAAPAALPGSNTKDDVAAWFELGAQLEAAKRAEAAELTRKIGLLKADVERLEAERDAKLKQADQIAGFIVAGGK